MGGIMAFGRCKSFCILSCTCIIILYLYLLCVLDLGTNNHDNHFASTFSGPHRTPFTFCFAKYCHTRNLAYLPSPRWMEPITSLKKKHTHTMHAHLYPSSHYN